MAKTAAERQRDYRKRHPERVAAYKRSHPDLVGNRRRNRRLYAKSTVEQKEKRLRKNADFRTTKRGAACYLYWNAKRRAKVDGLEFELTKEWIEAALNEGTCQVTGLPFSFGNGRRPMMPSLDKKDPKLGYTKDNVQVVVWMYNAAKAEFSHNDVVRLARAIIEKQDAIS